MKAVLIIVAAFLFSQTTIAGEHSIKIGPPAIGSGGTNPTQLAPSDLEYTYVDKKQFELNISAFPGILYGKRFAKKGLYVSGGIGQLISANGYGLGIYNSFGYITGEASAGWHFNFEYKQTLGYSSSEKQVISPSALRIGFIWK